MERAASPCFKAAQLEIGLPLKDVPARHAIGIGLRFVLRVPVLERSPLGIPDYLLPERFGVPHEDTVGIPLRLIWNEGYMIASQQRFHSSFVILGSYFIRALRRVGFDGNGRQVGQSIKIDGF